MGNNNGTRGAGRVCRSTVSRKYGTYRVAVKVFVQMRFFRLWFYPLVSFASGLVCGCRDVLKLTLHIVRWLTIVVLHLQPRLGRYRGVPLSWEARSDKMFWAQNQTLYISRSSGHFLVELCIKGRGGGYFHPWVNFLQHRLEYAWVIDNVFCRCGYLHLQATRFWRQQ